MLLESAIEISSILAWTPGGCCIAAFNSHRDAYDHFAKDIILLDIATGQSRPLIPNGIDYPAMARFKGWTQDGRRIIATDTEFIQKSYRVHGLLMFDIIDNTVSELPFDGPGQEFEFGGFSPDERHFVYGVSVGPDSVFQLRVVGTAPAVQSDIGMDLTSDLPRLSGIAVDESYAIWTGLSWTASGIYGAVTHWHLPW